MASRMKGRSANLFMSPPPGTLEQFDGLIAALGGTSLKSEARLWENFVHLRKARNSFAHEGQAVVDRIVVTAQHAANLVTGAEEIVRWVESQLPATIRRQRSGAAKVPFGVYRRLEPPEGTHATGGRSLMSNSTGCRRGGL